MLQKIQKENAIMYIIYFHTLYYEYTTLNFILQSLVYNVNDPNCQVYKLQARI